MSPEKMIEHLEHLGLGSWQVCQDGNLYRKYSPPAKSRRQPGYPRVAGLLVRIKPAPNSFSMWMWSVTGESKDNGDICYVRFGTEPSLDQAALEADGTASEYLERAFRP